MLVPKNQHKPSSLPAQKKNPKNQNIKKVARANPDNCGGGCSHSSCRCGASITSLSLPVIIELKAKNQFAASKKQKFGFKEAYYSSGFFSIWLPPKIS
jgi:hypothetical protein